MSAKVEIPGLREAYEAETAAVARIASLRARLPVASADVVLRRRDRDALAGRAARGEAITGGDLRKADELILDTEATVTLLTEALPAAVKEAQAASSARAGVEGSVKRQRAEQFTQAYQAATSVLRTAQEAHDRALADTKRFPTSVQAEMDAVFDQHGRDLAAARTVETINYRQEVNRQRQGTGLAPLVDLFDDVPVSHSFVPAPA
ncbi:MAG: hypothetical protein ACRYHQ_41320 [Janthinobacterium lividum]